MPFIDAMKSVKIGTNDRAIQLLTEMGDDLIVNGKIKL